MQRLLLEDCHKAAKALGGECLSEQYVNGYSPMRWRCGNGHEWSAIFNNIRRGKAWCRICKVGRPFDRPRLEALAALRGLVYEGAEDQVRALDKTEWSCKVGHHFEARPSEIDYRKSGSTSGCAQCYGNTNYSLAKAIEMGSGRGFTWVSGEYKNNRSKMLWRCCRGHEFLANVLSVNQGHGCVRCVTGGERKGQIFCYEFVKSICPDTQQEVRGLLPSRRLEIDIWVPSKRVAFEVDGWFHFRGTPEGLAKVQERDLRKDRECKEAGIALTRLTRFDVRRDKSVQALKQTIQTALGVV